MISGVQGFWQRWLSRLLLAYGACISIFQSCSLLHIFYIFLYSFRCIMSKSVSSTNAISVFSRVFSTFIPETTAGLIHIACASVSRTRWDSTGVDFATIHHLVWTEHAQWRMSFQFELAPHVRRSAIQSNTERSGERALRTQQCRRASSNATRKQRHQRHQEVKKHET